MTRPTAIIADDEPLLRAELRERLHALWPALEIVADCADGLEAVDHGLRLRPAVAFLDVSMPRMDGMAAARRLRVEGYAGELVFVTAHEAHALAAFERRAVDYLVKPLDDVRLADTMARLQARLAPALPVPAAPDATALAELQQRLAGTLEQAVQRGVQQALAARPADATLRWLRATRGHEQRLLAVDDVACLRAAAGYTSALTAEGEHLINETLRQLAAALDPALFVQVHRNAIVNLRFVAGTRRLRPGHYVVDLRHGLGEVAATRPLSEFIDGR